MPGCAVRVIILSGAKAIILRKEARKGVARIIIMWEAGRGRIIRSMAISVNFQISNEI
jgi:hypothetical protein